MKFIEVSFCILPKKGMDYFEDYRNENKTNSRSNTDNGKTSGD